MNGFSFLMYFYLL